ncbi:MAG: transcriptional regulator [Deltaproteobacteria bacterium]|nr:transcriptional regulator [Deltaproteobacteria bacterium]MBW2179509.1 transcriptional regulator [Deltaproteobacteria bacterium]MBW2365236.1 transcriptional regulator [Deltaproteobacteria bacterium]
MAPIDKIIHERARLLILIYLASNERQEISFNELQEKLDFTSGNLSIQLKKLKEVKYLEINKTFKNNKPYTTIQVTPEGTEALNKYIEEMEDIIHALRK